MRGGDDIAGPSVSYCKVDELEAYEEAMSAVRVLYGEVGVAEAAKKLRAGRHVELARRLRSASSRRNKKAHPDPVLARELLFLADVVEGTPSGTWAGTGFTQLAAEQAKEKAAEPKFGYDKSCCDGRGGRQQILRLHRFRCVDQQP